MAGSWDLALTMKQHRYFILLGLGLCFAASGLRAQAGLGLTPGSGSAEDSVRATVNLLFSAMKNSDSDALRSAFTDSAILQTIYNDKEGKIAVANYPVAEFAKAIAHLPNGAADERVQFDVVRVEGPLGIVWAPYRFYYNGKLTHCGIDSFQLLRTEGGWKIMYLVDTRKKNCE